MPKTLNFYIIFHSKLFKDNLKDFTDQEIKDWFSWVAVNETIPKQIPDWVPKDQLIYEYKLPTYNPMYQINKFYQNSFFYHFNTNKQLYTSRYIGFGQYDMKFNAEEFRSIMSMLENDSADKVVTLFPYPPEGVIFGSPELETYFTETFIKPYEQYTHISHSLESLAKWPLFLMHSFIVPSWFFKQMMEFMEWNLPTILKSLDWNLQHLAGTLERLFALCISAGIEEGRFRKVLHIRKTDHNGAQHSGDPFRNIPTGKDFESQ